MSEIQDEIDADALRPRPVFLVAAAISIGLALGAYLFEEEIVAGTGGGQLSFAFLLVFLVLVAMGLVMCFRNPRLGNRLLGYDVVLRKPNKGAKSDLQFSAGFKAETGADKKRMNSKRKQARYNRRKLAQATRDMQQEQASEAAASTPAANTPKDKPKE